MKLAQHLLLVRLSALMALLLVSVSLQASQRSDSNAADTTESAGREESVAQTSPELSVEEILTTTADPESYGDAPRCIATRRIRSSTVLNDRHVAFRVSTSKYYLVQFRNRCPMLERNATISYETRSDRLCTLDSIRGLIGLGATARFGPPCQIPGFQEISREQLVALQQQLTDDRRRPELVEEPSASSVDDSTEAVGEDDS